MSSSAKSFIDKEREYRGGYSPEVFQLLGWAYKPFAAQSVFWIVLGWTARVMLLGNSVVTGFWMDSLGDKSKANLAHPYFANWNTDQYLHLLSALCLGGLLLTWIFRLGFSRLSVKAISSIYDEVTVRVSRFPIRFFDRTPVGRVVTRFSSDYGNMFRMFGGPLSEFFGIVFDLIASLVLLLNAHWLGLVCYVTLLLANLLIYQVNKGKIRKARRDQGLLRSPGVAHFAETVQGANVIRVFGKEQVFYKRFQRLDGDFIQSKGRAIVINAFYALQMMITTYGIAFIAGVVGLWLVQHQRLSAGTLASIMVLLSLAGSNFQMFFDWMAQLEEAFVGVERMNEYLRLPLEPEAKLPAGVKFATDHPRSSKNDPKIEALSQKAIGVEFKNLWFRYEDDFPWILKGIDFSIRPGEKVGVIGRTGAGKTTLFQVIQKFYPFQKGKVLLDSQNLGVAQTRSRLAVIPQDPVLFNSTLRENLDIEGKLDDAILLATLERVGLGAWLTRNPSALDVVIEERGKNLSQGEKQLIVMARMSLIHRPLVLMDEATSSIDPQTEQLLVRAMHEVFKAHTQLIIAHRLSTIESCDRVLWLKDGQVELFDKPERVLKNFRGDEIGV